MSRVTRIRDVNVFFHESKSRMNAYNWGILLFVIYGVIYWFYCFHANSKKHMDPVQSLQANQCDLFLPENHQDANKMYSPVTINQSIA